MLLDTPVGQVTACLDGRPASLQNVASFRRQLLLEDCLYGSTSNTQTSFWNAPCVYIGDFLCDISGHFGQALLLPSVFILLGWVP